MSSFAGLPYLTIRSSVCIILIWILVFATSTISAKLDPVTYVGNLTSSVLNFNEQITRAHFLLLQASIRPVPAKVSLLWKGPPKLCINVTLYPCERSRQNHLVSGLHQKLSTSCTFKVKYTSKDTRLTSEGHHSCQTTVKAIAKFNLEYRRVLFTSIIDWQILQNFRWDYHQTAVHFLRP